MQGSLSEQRAWEEHHRQFCEQSKRLQSAIRHHEDDGSSENLRQVLRFVDAHASFSELMLRRYQLDSDIHQLEGFSNWPLFGRIGGLLLRGRERKMQELEDNSLAPYREICAPPARSRFDAARHLLSVYVRDVVENTLKAAESRRQLPEPGSIVAEATTGESAVSPVTTIATAPELLAPEFPREEPPDVTTPEHSSPAKRKGGRPPDDTPAIRKLREIAIEHPEWGWRQLIAEMDNVLERDTCTAHKRRVNTRYAPPNDWECATWSEAVAKQPKGSRRVEYWMRDHVLIPTRKTRNAKLRNGVIPAALTLGNAAVTSPSDQLQL